MSVRAPTFLLIGAARSGTTAVIEALRRHPDVFITDPKEPHFLAYGGGTLDFAGPGDDATVNRLAVADPDAYRRLFAGATSAVAVGEGSVSTLYAGASALERIDEFAPGAQLVVILRDPVERAFSAYQYLRARGFEPCEDFADALEREPERITGRWQHLWHYRAMSRYGEQLRPFAEAAGDRLHVFFFEDLATRHDALIAELCRRIGVPGPPPPAAPSAPLNRSGQPRSALVQAVVRFPARHPRIRAVGRRVVPYGLWQRVRSANLTTASIDPYVAERLWAELADDRAVLSALLDDLGDAVWGSRPLWSRIT